MDNTINDVWRLLFDRKIHVAVLVDVFERSKVCYFFTDITILKNSQLMFEN